MLHNGTFGDWVKERRHTLDLTQRELAEQAGCSLAMIRKLERNERRPSKHLAERLAELLQIPPLQQAAFLASARVSKEGNRIEQQPQSADGNQQFAEHQTEAFTERELAVLQRLIHGDSNREIAAQLTISYTTVKWYIRRLYSKLNVYKRLEAIQRARELHLLDGVQAARMPDRRHQMALSDVAYTVARPTTPAERNRQNMLQNVHKFWVEGVLQNSLYGLSLIELGLETAAWAVEHPWDIHLLAPNGSPQRLPPATRIAHVFEQLNGKLLILGELGSGKTTLLLELARDLLTRADNDFDHPIPVVFNLSSWGESRKPLAEWLVDELNSAYHVPRKLAVEWVADDDLLLLLDGLDEVAVEWRDACIESINIYRQEHGFVDIVICSRLADYERLTTRLELNGAVVIQSMDAFQIDTYLRRLGAAAETVRELLAADEQLQQVATSPLMLNVMLLSFNGESLTQLAARETLEAQRQELFASYVQRMFERVRGQHAYAADATRYYLTWLAQRMAQHGTSIFHIEDLQPAWLNTIQYVRYRTRLRYILIWVFALALIGYFPYFSYAKGSLLLGGTATLFFALGGVILGWTISSNYLGRWYTYVLALGGAGILLGLGSGITSFFTIDVSLFWSGLVRNVLLFFPYLYFFERFDFSPETIKPSAVATFSWSRVKWWAVLVFFIAGFTVGLGTSLRAAIGGGLVLAIVAMLFAGYTPALLSTRFQPNQAILNSHRNAITLGPLVASGFGLVFLIPTVVTRGNLVAGTARGVGIFLWVAVIMYIALGGYAVIQHHIILWLYQRDGVMPANYARFLDYAVSIILLRRVGGGYIFIHRYLLEYFAAQPLVPHHSGEQTEKC